MLMIVVFTRFLFDTDEDKTRAKNGIKDLSKYEINEIVTGDSIFCNGITSGDLV